MTPAGNTTNGNGNGRSRSDLDRFEAIVHNALLARQEFFKNFADPRRSIPDECGFPAGVIQPQLFQDLYDREALATRVVEVLPKESWQVSPTCYEDEDADTITEFEEAWDGLSKSLRGDFSFHQDESGSVVWEYLRRADILSGIGQYGVILLGLDDGKDLSEPADLLARGKRGKKASRQLLFLRCFPESLAPVARFETDPANPRFGQPIEYTITFNDPNEGQQSGIGLSTATQAVHWTRVIHVADNLGSSEVFGVPRMRPVLNRLLDLQKLYGGSAEMYWRGAFPGLSFETHPSLGGDVEVDRQSLRDDFEQYSNGLQRALFLMGIGVKTLSPTVVDPTPQIATQIEAICIKIGIPIRVFKGSERGELASSQDDAAWNDRLRERQRNYLTPRLIVPFVDRLIALGVLPEPEGYSVEWPDLTSHTQQEKADIATKKTAALAQYVGGGIEAVMPPMDYLTRILGFNEEEADAILENAAAALEEQEEEEMLKMEEEMELQEEKIERGLAPDPTAQQQPPATGQEEGAGEEEEPEKPQSKKPAVANRAGWQEVLR